MLLGIGQRRRNILYVFSLLLDDSRRHVLLKELTNSLYFIFDFLKQHHPAFESVLLTEESDGLDVEYAEVLADEFSQLFPVYFEKFG